MADSSKPKSIYDQEIGDRLRAARVNAGFKHQIDAAKALGINKQNVTDQESGARGTSVMQAIQYARVYRVDPWWILTGQSGVEAAKMAGGDLPDEVPSNADEHAIAWLIECYAKLVVQDERLAGTPIEPLAAALCASLKQKSKGKETSQERIIRLRLSTQQAILGAATTQTSLPPHQADRMERAVTLLLNALPLADY